MPYDSMILRFSVRIMLRPMMYVPVEGTATSGEAQDMRLNANLQFLFSAFAHSAVSVTKSA